MKKLLIAAFALALMITPLAGCSSSSEDDCGDVAKKICERLEECRFFLNVGGVAQSTAQCTSFLANLSAQEGDTDAECREGWDLVKDLGCGDFRNWLDAAL